MNNIESVPAFTDIPETVLQDTNKNNDSAWFFGAKTDLIIGCGAWSVPLLLLTYYGTLNFPQAVITLFYGLALVFNYPHYMATIYRAYRTKEDFAKYRIFTVHITLLIALLIILGHFSSFILAIVFTLYLTWSPFHYTGQNFGIGLMFARRCGVETTVNTRRAFYISFLTPYLMFFLAFHSAIASDDYVLSLGIPHDVAKYLWIIAAAAFLFSTIYSFRSFIKQTGFSAMTAPLVILSTQLVWFVIPTALTFFTDLGVMQNSATIAVLAVMHSIQYLWITTYYARREKLSEVNHKKSVPDNRGVWNYLSYFSVLIVGGIALFIPVPWLASRILHLDFGTSFLIVTALVNIHHFILDGAIWKLRDGRIAAFLLNKNKGDENTVTGSSGLANWFSGSSNSARLVKISAVFALLLLAGIDQAKFYYSGKGNDSANLEFATRLNPFDASLKLKLARMSEEKGNLNDAQNKLVEVININPALRQAQDSLARLLIQTGQYEKALNQYQEMFRHLKPDANALINYGILAFQFDRQDEAINSFQEALKLDKNQPNAHLHLAELMEKRKDLVGAIKHYQQFIVLSGNNLKSSASSKTTPNPYEILRVVLSLGSAYQQIGETEKASKSYDKALVLAKNLSDDEIIAEVMIYRAELEKAKGNLQQSLKDFQNALTLKKKDSKYGVKPEDWFKFGKLLKELKVSSRMILACFIKAEIQLEHSKPEEQNRGFSDMLKKEIRLIESQSNTEKIKLDQNNIDDSLQQALLLKLS